jgi:plasmid stabilization system protein ParE
VSRYRVSSAALHDIDEIADRIQELSPRAAERFVDAIYDAFDLLGRHPHFGHRRRDVTNRDVFFWTAVKRFAIIYRKSNPIEIVRVRAWAQDVAALLGEGERMVVRCVRLSEPPTPRWRWACFARRSPATPAWPPSPKRG